MAKRKKKIDIETASREELIAHIKSLEASRDQLKQNNKRLSNYYSRLETAIRALASDGSLIFQAMAEKAGVRGHPSVSKVVAYFDAFHSFGWGEAEELPTIETPDDWDFDREDEWSGDADMQLNSPVARLLDIICHYEVQTKLPERVREELNKAVVAVEHALRTHIDGIKSAHGFTTKSVDISRIPDGIGLALLDLAQDMDFANEWLRRDLRASVYRRVCADLYRLAFHGHEEEPRRIDVKVFAGPAVPF